MLNPQSFHFLTQAKICRTNESQICVSLLSVFSNCTPNKYSKHWLTWTVTRCSGWHWVLSAAMLYLCEYGCALWDEQCPYWHSCSSCTCTSHRRSSPGSPAAHQTLPPLACWPPRTAAGGRSARFWGRLKTKTHVSFLLNALKTMTTMCMVLHSDQLGTALPVPSLHTQSPRSCLHDGFAVSGIPGIPLQNPRAPS